MLYIVDGTGPASDAVYRAKMKDGHCQKIYQNFFSYSNYFRGPPVGGGTNLTKEQLKLMQHMSRDNMVMALTLAAHGYTETNINQRGQVLEAINIDKGKIYLCGYSRGGATVVSVANALNKAGRAVEAMFLLDPVDSDASLADTEFIPPNVKETFMAYRSMAHVRGLEAQAEREWREIPTAVLKAMVGVMSMNVIPSVPSFLPIRPVAPLETAKSLAEVGQQSAEAVNASWRSFEWRNFVARDVMFKTCVKGVAASAGQRPAFIRAEFAGTHGAMGGCPWEQKHYPPNTNFFEMDAECKLRTWTWLNDCILRTNFMKDASANA